MNLVRCPDCDLPAEISDRFTLPSTDGPVEHVKTKCAAGHWFTLSAADVAAIPVLAAVSAAHRRAA
jgi:hypothetical protein